MSVHSSKKLYVKRHAKAMLKYIQTERTRYLSQLECKSSKLEIVGSKPAVGKMFFYFITLLPSAHGSQLESADTNKINLVKNQIRQTCPI